MEIKETEESGHSRNYKNLLESFREEGALPFRMNDC